MSTTLSQRARGAPSPLAPAEASGIYAPLPKGEGRSASGQVRSHIERGTDGEATAVKDVGVDHGCSHVFVTQQILDGSNIVAVLQQMRSKGMAQRMATDAFLNGRFASRVFDSALQGGRVNMMTVFLPVARIEGAF